MTSTMPTVAVEPLTRQGFAPYGQVIEFEGSPHYPINEGMTERYHDLATIELGGTEPRPLLSLMRGQPSTLPLTLRMVERHPLGSQAFYPLSTCPFLVIVAGDQHGTPTLPQAFRTAPGQGINIAMNVWHGVLTPLEAEADFLVVDRGGVGTNLQEFFFETPYVITER